jgi:2-oxoisovalerate dehydrogenase E1 component alpha subunit
VYRAPVILNVVNNQWAISTFQAIAGGEGTTFAARGVGCGIAVAAGGRQRLPGRLRGLALGRRARAPQPRADADRVGDLPRRRALHLGRPVALPPGRRLAALPARRPDRALKQHLIGLGAWSESEHEQAQQELEAEVAAALKEAESHGTLLDGHIPPLASMFEDVYKDMPPRTCASSAQQEAA